MSKFQSNFRNNSQNSQKINLGLVDEGISENVYLNKFNKFSKLSNPKDAEEIKEVRLFKILCKNWYQEFKKQ